MTRWVSGLILVIPTTTFAQPLAPTGSRAVERSNFEWVDTSRDSRAVRLVLRLPILADAQRSPLVFFLPGWGNAPEDYASQLEDLARHGYAVAAIHEASSKTPDEASAAEWARDAIFALDRLAVLPTEPRLDLDRVGAFGHSHGGRAAAAACLLDDRIRACLNEDGSLDDASLQRPYWPIPGRRISGTFAMLDWFDPGFDAAEFRAMGSTAVSFARARLTPTRAGLAAYESVAAGAFRITLLQSGMHHTAFSDLPLASARTQADLARHREYLESIRRVVNAFFDLTLRREPQPLLDCSGSENLLVQCFGQTP